jgi:hypothetical protein
VANEKLNFNTYDSGWTSGAIGDVDEAVASADGAVISTTIKNDTALMGLTASVVEDADTVTAIDIVVRARTTGSGVDSLGVELLIGGVVQGVRQDILLTASFQNLTFSDANWDTDRTAAEMDGAEVRLHARQGGMPVDAGHEVDCGDIDVVFTEAGGQSASGAATLAPATASGTAKVHKKASGAATLAPLIASGTASGEQPAISYIGGNSASGDSAAPSITHGLTIEAGDVLIVTMGVDTNSITIDDDNGANPFDEDWDGAPGTHTFRQYVGSRVAGASEPSSYQWTLGASEGWCLMIQQFRGVDNADIYDVPPSAATEADGSSSTATTPAMTTSADGSEGICLFSADSASVNWSAYTNSYTDELEPGGGLVSAVVRRNFASSGVQPAVSATVSLSRNWACHQFSLRAAIGNPTASGAATLAAVVAAGVAKVHKKASGAATLAAAVAAGTAKKRLSASGGATLAPATAAGTTKFHRRASGAATLTAAVAAGVAKKVVKANGAATLAAATASGSAVLPGGNIIASGAAILAPAIAAGTAKKRIPASGAATLAPVIASGAAKKRIPASGAATLAAVIASGSAKVHRRASGAAILAATQASGASKLVRKASGAAILAALTGSGSANVAVPNIILDQIALEGRVLAIELEGREIALQLRGQVNSET